jgi:hypothetical protein
VIIDRSPRAARPLRRLAERAQGWALVLSGAWWLANEKIRLCRVGGREGGGRRAAPVEHQPARIVAECEIAASPLPVQYRVKSGCTTRLDFRSKVPQASQVVLLTFRSGKKTPGGAGTHTGHTGAHRGTRIFTQTNRHNPIQTHQHTSTTARRPVGLAPGLGPCLGRSARLPA